MPVTEILQLVDQLVFKQTGNHLNNLQKDVIQGIWQNKTYAEMAKEFGYDSENHIGNVSRELYKTLSAELGEDINKHNFSWTIERLFNSTLLQQPVFNMINNSNSHINLCSNTPQNYAKITEENFSNKSYYDLALAPKINHFCGRETELQTLSHWITNQNPHLISVLGLSGIGKTTLVKQLVDLNLPQFDLVIWKSIKITPSLDTILTEILSATHPDPIQNQHKFTQFFNLLRQQKCLIVLDDVQELFTSGQFAGQYKPEFKDYKSFFTKIAEIDHQSIVILISQEQCQEMIGLDEELYPVKCLELQGLDSPAILKNLRLKDEASWLNLLNRYEGHPVYLKDIAILIKSIFGGKVSDFLQAESLLLTEDMKFTIRELFDRLSALEQQIVLEISKSNQPVSREYLRKAVSLSEINLINGLQSLKKRYLVKSIERDAILFDLSTVFREYLRNCG
ncbi:ATPase domain-containing protein [Planktothricoides sp. SR001]|uniref:NB-ARC domain-containing protein n=1 Tax=Planktothricoides sp. SR001 TaxID=1705388 RepID=UPI0006C2EE63|nr:NB-ARC domain-containing protein [Planktothricoides sp. SR001]KOR34818.1 ATPase domain-containing protein [Planktothricoides sp. SR001]